MSTMALSRSHTPDSIVVDGGNVCHENLHVVFGLHLWLIPHEPMLLIAGNDIYDNAVRLTQSSLHAKQQTSTQAE